MKKLIITFSIINIILYLFTSFIVWDIFWIIKLSKWSMDERFFGLLFAIMLNLFSYIIFKITEN